MVNKSKLKMALVAEKGVDFKKLNLKKKEKAARKSKAQKGGDKSKSNGNNAEEDWEDADEEAKDSGADLGKEDSGSDEEEGGVAAVPMQASFHLHTPV